MIQGLGALAIPMAMLYAHARKGSRRAGKRGPALRPVGEVGAVGVLMVGLAKDGKNFSRVTLTFPPARYYEGDLGKALLLSMSPAEAEQFAKGLLRAAGIGLEDLEEPLPN